MRRDSLSKQDIIEILSAREQGSWEFFLRITPVGVSQLEPLKKLTIEQIMQVVINTNRRMLELVVHRLLIPGRSGRLIAHQETQRILRVAGRELIRNLPDEDQLRIAPLVHPIADFLQRVLSVWYADSTYEEEWEYLEAVCALAQAHMLEPAPYLRCMGGAQDDVLRWVSDPERYRAKRMAPFDALHPEQLEGELVACVRACEQALHTAHGARIDERIIRAMVPSTTRFWHVRAERVRGIEDEIRRIWPSVAIDGSCEA